MNYYQGFISATSEKEAHKILDDLLDQHLVAGGQILSGESNHHWQGGIERLPYWTIMVFCKMLHADEIIRKVEDLSKDDTPGITFVKIEKGNQKFLDWIEKESKND